MRVASGSAQCGRWNHRVSVPVEVCQDTGSLPRAGFRGAVARPVPRRRDDRLNVEERKDSSLPLSLPPRCSLSLALTSLSLSLPLRVPAIARLFPRKRNPRSISARRSLAPSARRLITEACRPPSLLSSLASPVRSLLFPSIPNPSHAADAVCSRPRRPFRVLPDESSSLRRLAEPASCRLCPLSATSHLLAFTSRSPSCSAQCRRLFCLIVDSFSQGIISVQPRL